MMKHFCLQLFPIRQLRIILSKLCECTNMTCPQAGIVKFHGLVMLMHSTVQFKMSILIQLSPHFTIRYKLVLTSSLYLNFAQPDFFNFTNFYGLFTHVQIIAHSVYQEMQCKSFLMALLPATFLVSQHVVVWHIQNTAQQNSNMYTHFNYSCDKTRLMIVKVYKKFFIFKFMPLQ